jgi:hypothetical protein
VNTLVHIDLTEEPTQLTAGDIVVLDIRQVNLSLLDSPQKTLGVAILPRFTHLGHADLHFGVLEYVDGGSRRILDSLVGVMASWRSTMGRRPVQGEQGQQWVKAG